MFLIRATNRAILPVLWRTPKAACLWFKAATGYPDDDGIRLMLCREAYGKIERALRCYL